MTTIALTDALFIARRAAHKFQQQIPHVSHDDALSIALEAGWRASEKWDPRKGVECGGAFVRVTVDRALIDWWRRETGHRWIGVRKEKPPPMLSLNKRVSSGGWKVHRRPPGMSVELQDIIPAPQVDPDMVLDLLRAWRLLDQRQADVLRDRAVGTPGHVTAARWGIDQSRVSQIGKQAANQLRLALAA